MEKFLFEICIFPNTNVIHIKIIYPLSLVCNTLTLNGKEKNQLKYVNPTVQYYVDLEINSLCLVDFTHWKLHKIA